MLMVRLLRHLWRGVMLDGVAVVFVFVPVVRLVLVLVFVGWLAAVMGVVRGVVAVVVVAIPVGAFSDVETGSGGGRAVFCRKHPTARRGKAGHN